MASFTPCVSGLIKMTGVAATPINGQGCAQA